MRKLVDFLGINRSMAGLLAMVILVGMGERMAERFLPIYLIALGGGIISVGLLNGLDNLLSALYSFPGGYMADKYGTKKALLIFNCLAMSGFLIVILVPLWQAVILGSFLFISWTAISLPATMELVSKILPKNKRTMGVSMHSLVRRIPMALGPLAGGLMIGHFGERNGVRIAFIGALIMAIIAAFFQQKLISDDAGSSAGKHVEKNPFALYKEMPSSLKRLLVSDILVRFCEQIPYAFVVLWAMKEIESPVSAFQFGILTSVEMATAVLVYIPVAWLADKTTKKPFVALTFMFFTAFPLVTFFSRSFPALMIAFIVRGLKEFGEPTRKALIMDLAPEGRKAAMFGLYYLLRDVIVSLAAFGGAFLWQIGPALNFFAAFLCGLTGTLWFIIFGKEN